MMHQDKDKQEELKHIERLIQIHFLVYNFFDDINKTKLWFKTNNPMLGNFTPNDMVLMGKTEKLLNWIKQQLLYEYN